MMRSTERKEKNIPELRFPGFKGEWEEKKLGEVARFSKGRLVSKNDIQESGQTYAIRYGELYTTYHEVIAEVFSRTELDPKKLELSASNDVIIPSSGETQLDIATAACVKIDGVALGGDLTILRGEEDGVFLSYYLNTAKKHAIARLAQGNSVVHLYASSLKGLKVNLPERNEQQKIAGFLTSVDEWIQNLKGQKEKLEEYKKGVMQKIFSQEIRFKDEDGKDFPDWEEKRLGEVAKIEMGQSPGSASYNGHGDGVGLIQGNADIKNRRTVIRVWTNEPTKMCSVGDLILAVRAPVGLIAIADHRACIGRGVAAIKPTKRGDIKFIYQFLLWFEKRWVKYEQGTTFTAVNTRDVKGLKLRIPIQQEQQKIAGFLTAIDEKIKLVDGKMKKAEEWKKGLMQKMFV